MSILAKPSETSARFTAFCAAKIEGPAGFLWIDGNGKITAGNGTLDEPKPNAFSLVQIEDCPGATATCKIGCYVHGLQKHAPETHALYVHNSIQIRKILLGGPDDGRADVWATVMADWIGANCAGGFRWHVSGDVFCDRYAQWIAVVCQRSPNINHWIYTRSFGSVLALTKASNLVVNISCDRDNIIDATRISERYGLRLCYLTSDGHVPAGLPDGSVIFPDYNLRGGNPAGQEWFSGLSPDYKSFVCPVDYHGKSENRRCGPCNRCLT